MKIAAAVAGLMAGLALCAGLGFWMTGQEANWTDLFREFSLKGLTALVLSSLLLMLSGARKWAVLSTALYGPEGEEPERGFFLRHILWQNWVGQFAPPSLAIVIGRGVASARMKNLAVRDGLKDGLWDQAMEYALLVGMIPAGFAFLWFKAGADIFALLLAVGVSVAVLLLYGAANLFRKELVPFLPVLILWSFVRAALVILRLIAGGAAMGLDIAPLTIAAAAPVVSLVALAPLTPGNLGLAEWGWVGALTLGGVDPARAGFFALGFRLLAFFLQTLFVVSYETIRRFFGKP